MHLENDDSYIACNVPDYSFHWSALVKYHVAEFSQGELKKTCITKENQHAFGFVCEGSNYQGEPESFSSTVE